MGICYSSPFHESLPLAVPEDSAFSSASLGDEAAGPVDARGVKLDELRVFIFSGCVCSFLFVLGGGGVAYTRTEKRGTCVRQRQTTGDAGATEERQDTARDKEGEH